MPDYSRSGSNRDNPLTSGDPRTSLQQKLRARGVNRDSSSKQPASDLLSSIASVGIANDKILVGSGTNTVEQKSLSNFAQTILDDADAGAVRTTISAQPLEPGLTSIAGAGMAANQILVGTGTDAYGKTTLSEFGKTIIDDADAAAVRTTISAQALDADLTALAAVTIAANQLIYGTDAAEWAKATLTAFGRSLIDDASASAARTTLGLGAVALLASIANANMASMGAATVKGSVGGGTPADLTMTQLRSILKPIYRVPFHADAKASLTLDTHPSTDQFLTNTNFTAKKLDLGGGVSEVRLMNRVLTSSASSNSPRIVLRYSATYTNTVSNYRQIGASDVTTVMSATGHKDTGWIDLVAGAKVDDCFVHIIQTGGDSSAAPILGAVDVEFR